MKSHRAVLKLLQNSRKTSPRCLTRSLSVTSAQQYQRKTEVERHLSDSYYHGVGPMPLSSETVGEALLKTVEKTPDRECVVFCEDGVRRTFAELMKEIDQFAASLHNLGFRKGDCIGIWGPSTLEWVITQLATSRIGAILVNVNPAYQVRELEFSLNHTKMKAIIAPASFKTQDYYGMLKGLSPELPNCSPTKLKSKRIPNLSTVIIMGSEKFAGALNFDDVMQIGSPADVAEVQNISRKLDFDEPINIQFTSGTTGNPKGATLSHHNIINNVRYIGDRLGYGDHHHRIACQVPLYHCFGMVGGPVAMTVYGSAVIFPSAGYDPGCTLKSLEQEKCNVVYGTPTMYIDMCSHPDLNKYDYTALEKGIMAGSPCPPEVVYKVDKTFGTKIINSIEDIQDGTFSPLVNLLGLNLKNNGMNSLGDETFTGLSKLKTLIVSDNAIEQISVSSFFPMRNLRKLLLGGNQLSSVPTQAFSGGVMFRLVTLSLRKNTISTIEDGAFAALRALAYLTLANNGLVTVHPNGFTGVSKLKSLQLNGNELEYIPEIQRLPNLKKLGLNSNPWKCDCKMQGFRRWIESTPFELVCDEPPYLADREFKTLDIEDLYCDEMEEEYGVEGESARDSTEKEVTENGEIEEEVPRESNSGEFYCPEDCICDKELKHVDCNDRGYSSPPPSLTPSTSLLDLRQNRLTSLEPESFHSVPALISLHLQHNKIKRIEARAFGDLGSLIYLYLEDNEIDTLRPGSFKGLRSLSYLFLDRNRLSFLPAGVFRPLNSVFSIFIRNNVLESISGKNLEGTDRLRWLYLSGNRISEIGNNTFRSVRDLERLQLDRNELVSVPQQALSDLPFLLWLDLSKNLIDTIPGNAFRSQPRLVKLLLGENQMYMTQPEAFNGLHSLQILNISDNILEVFPPLPRLSSLQEVAYGTTENSPVTFMNFLDDSAKVRAETVGIPAPFTEVKVVDENNRIVPVNTPGELWIRGYCVMIGYWEDDAKTADTITRDGWYKTGDIATIDEKGYGRIVGRTKDMIIRGGENIYPTEIEDVLHTMEKIDNVQVFGVPDQRMGEIVACWISLREGETVTEDEIRQFCKGKMAPFKIPQHIKFVTEFPLTVTRKVQKFKMQEMYAEELGIKN